MRNYLVERGVPDQHVVSDFAGFDTWDSCVRAKNVFGVNRAVLVSPAGKALVDAVLRPDPHFPGPPEPGIAFAAPR